MNGRLAGRAGRQRGTSAVEFAIAAPVLLLLGLGALQWALVFHARQAIEHATIEAARSASVGYGLPDALDAGLARGLLPYWGTLPQIRSAGADRLGAAAVARTRLLQARAAGWLVVRRLSPTRESFADWAEPALDGWGRPIPGRLEIPNDNLMYAEHRSPNGGAATVHLGLPVGRSSGQTLLDANLLKVEVVYGVPMTVPLVGRIAASAARLAGGCLPAERGGCVIHQAPDDSGRPVPRWPIASVATIRMQSPARQTGDAPSPWLAAGSLAPPPAGSAASAGGDASPSGRAERASSGLVTAGRNGGEPVAGFLALSHGSDRSPGASLSNDGEPGGRRQGSGSLRASGWLSLGGDRVFTTPGACEGS